MIFPVILIAFATLTALVVGYGTHPNWAQYPHGLQLIIWVRILQWPLVTLSLLFALGVVVLVICGRRRAWWLIGLSPVLALFVHRFVTDPFNTFRIVDNPSFVVAAQAEYVKPQDYVIGVNFGDHAYAFPFSVLYRNPVVIVQEHDKRMMLMWSAFANHALVTGIEHQLKARDLEIVSMPANALLLYNTRNGQFVNALKGQLPDGNKPAGLKSSMAIYKLPWQQWRAMHPESLVMLPVPVEAALGPPGPIEPYYKMPPTVQASQERIVMIMTTQPVAVSMEKVTVQPLNVPPGDVPVLLFRDRFGVVRGFDRRIDDLTPRFQANSNLDKPNIAFIDVDTRAGWNISGQAIEGDSPLKGRHLAPLMNVEDDVYLGIMKYWYPNMLLYTPPPETTRTSGVGNRNDTPVRETNPARRRPSRPRTPSR